MEQIFGVTSHWYRYEFAPSRGMIHWYGLAWHGDRQLHELLYEAVLANMSDEEMAKELAMWAEAVFGMMTSHNKIMAIQQALTKMARQGRICGLLKEQHLHLWKKTIHLSNCKLKLEQHKRYF